MRATASYSKEGLIAAIISSYAADRGRVSAIGVRVGFFEWIRLLSRFLWVGFGIRRETACIFIREKYSLTNTAIYECSLKKCLPNLHIYSCLGKIAHAGYHAPFRVSQISLLILFFLSSTGHLLDELVLCKTIFPSSPIPTFAWWDLFLPVTVIFFKDIYCQIQRCLSIF